jgi:hypothetical protein
VWPPHRLRLYFYGGHKSIEAILPRISQADSLAAKEVRDDLMWQIGEAWLEAQKREYGSGKALAEEVGISYQTCRMAATVAKRYSKLYDRSCLAAKQSKSEDEPPEDERDILIAKGPKPEAPDVPQVPPKPNVSFDAFLTASSLNDESADELLDAFERDALLPMLLSCRDCWFQESRALLRVIVIEAEIVDPMSIAA